MKHEWLTIVAAIKAGIPKDGIFWDYLDEERKLDNYGDNEYQRGIVEGARRFAGRLQEIVEGEAEG